MGAKRSLLKQAKKTGSYRSAILDKLYSVDGVDKEKMKEWPRRFEVWTEWNGTTIRFWLPWLKPLKSPAEAGY